MGIFSRRQGICKSHQARLCCIFGSGRKLGVNNQLEIRSEIFPILQLALAVLSSTMTVYLTSSANHECEAFPYPAGQGDDVRKRGGEEAPLMQPGPAQPEKKVRYFAAGSGIPEVKVKILASLILPAHCTDVYPGHPADHS